MEKADRLLAQLIETFYEQRPNIPRVSVRVKMAMIEAIKYCEENNIPLPSHTARLEEFRLQREKEGQSE